MNSNSLFYTNLENIDERIASLVSKFKAYAETGTNPVYIINRPLGEKNVSYSYDNAVVILIPKHRIMFINYGNDKDKFEDFYEDFVEDLGQLSKKYDYIRILGRPRQWKHEFTEKYDYSSVNQRSLDEFLQENRLINKEKERKGEFLISLLTGSINDVDRTGIDYPDTILEQIKRKIILFDGDQTRFIFDEPRKDKIVIQGLAGTGKTELLLHKIKELYLRKEDLKIVFTCHNKILADSLKKRISEFFDFMKVEEQIKWEEKLWVMSGWGSKGNPDSGVYSYICDYYNLSFERFSYNVTFDGVCRKALEELSKISDFHPCFDYILIDESQDFTESFFELCKKATKNCLYIAGDIFQNVFEKESISAVEPDFLLNKCYRTDPKTLMCAHAIGMGLFADTPDRYLGWLDDKAWEACGYTIKKADGLYKLYRKPLRRFEDLGSTGIRSIEILPIAREQYVSQIITIIGDLKSSNPSLQPDDIGIMFLENNDKNYQLANNLQTAIGEKFGWDVNIGYETKEKRKGEVFISNRNNVKGLEFPFVICFMQNTLDSDLQNRNSIYMMLTRSFITSYFILPDEEETAVREIEKGVDFVNNNGYLCVQEPNPKQKEMLNNAIISRNSIRKSQYDTVEEIMDEMRIGIDKENRIRLHGIIRTGYKDELDREKLYEIIKMNYTMMD